MNTDELLIRAVSEVIDRKHLKSLLKKGVKLRVKFGIDPTSPNLHLGHTVPLNKLRQFQDLGHTAVLIIGDYTAQIGDPSGRDKTRPHLTESQIKEYVKTYETQAFKILDPEKTEVRRQSEWFGKFDLKKVIELASKVSTWHIMSHETFAQRRQLGQSLMHHETLYPLLQGYDSVAVKADVELGGEDQKFNLLTGRVVQQAYGQPPQDIVLTPYLFGLGGKVKMSKTYGNSIDLTDLPNDMFGKVMSIPDELILPYFELVTDLEYKALDRVKKELRTANPRDVKARLAFLIVERFYDESAAETASGAFDLVFRQGGLPETIDEFSVDADRINIVEAVAAAKLASSKQQARRLIEQGGVRVDGSVVGNLAAWVNVGQIIQVGKRRFAKLVKQK